MTPYRDTPPYVGLVPTVPVTIASGASKAASAAADPPPDPPGILDRSQGLRVGPYAEFSVDEPIANSSRLVLPRITTPASNSRVVTVASYGGSQPCRILDPAVVGIPFWTTMSLSASGTPASGDAGGAPSARALSTARAWASADSVDTCRKACT